MSMIMIIITITIAIIVVFAVTSIARVINATAAILAPINAMGNGQETQASH